MMKDNNSNSREPEVLRKMFTQNISEPFSQKLIKEIRKVLRQHSISAPPSQELIKEVYQTHNERYIRIQEKFGIDNMHFRNDPLKIAAFWLENRPKDPDHDPAPIDEIIIKSSKGSVSIKSTDLILSMLEPIISSYAGQSNEDIKARINNENKYRKLSGKRRGKYGNHYKSRKAKALNKLLDKYPFASKTDKKVLIYKLMYIRGLRIESKDNYYYNPFDRSHREDIRKNIDRFLC